MPEAIHVIAGLGVSQGGPSYTVPRLCAVLRESCWDTRILTVDDPADPAASPDCVSALKQDFRGWPIAANLRISTALQRELRERSRACDVVHAHGVWLMPNVYAGNIAAACGKPLIVSPRGMLSPEALSFSRRKKQVFWAIMQERAYQAAAAWHATSEAEAADLRKFGIKGPIAVIPNGVDIPCGPCGEPAPPDGKGLVERVQGTRRLLFLSRLHPKKGLHTLLQCWSAAATEFPEWSLRIVGPDEANHLEELRKTVEAHAIPRVEFVGAAYGDAKWQEYRSSDVFILPTLNENFGVAVAEALGAGVPAIVTKGAPWKGLLDNKCGWWVDNNKDALLGALREALSLPEEVRRKMGRNGREWVLRAFSWSRIGEDMIRLYSWSSGRDQVPEFVLED